MLTSTPSRSHRSAARTTLTVLLVLVVVGVLVGVGYVVTQSGGHPRIAATATSAAAVVTTGVASVSPTPSATLPAGVAEFLALPVGTPPSPGADESRYPWHALVATLTGPRTVTAGSSPDYRVRLTNRTSAPISLAPCPAYDLTVGLSTDSYGLNCAGASSQVIAPSASVTFDLPVTIPRSLSSGTRTDVVWSLGWQPDRTSPKARLMVSVR